MMRRPTLLSLVGFVALFVLIGGGVKGQEVIKYSSHGYMANYPDNSPDMSDAFNTQVSKADQEARHYGSVYSQAELIKDGLDLMEHVGGKNNGEEIEKVAENKAPSYEDVALSAAANGASQAMTEEPTMDADHPINPDFEIKAAEAAAKGAAEAIETSTEPHSQAHAGTTKDGVSVDADGHLTHGSVEDALAQYSQKFEDVLKQYQEAQKIHAGQMEERDKEISELESDLKAEKGKLRREDVSKAELDSAMAAAEASMHSENVKIDEESQDMETEQAKEKAKLKKDLHRLMALKTLDIHLDEKDTEVHEKKEALEEERKHFAEDEKDFYSQEKDMMDEIKKWKTTSEELGEARHDLEKKLERNQQKWGEHPEARSRHLRRSSTPPSGPAANSTDFSNVGQGGSAIQTVRELVKHELKEEATAGSGSPVYDQAIEDMEQGASPSAEEQMLLKGLAEEGKELNASLQKLPLEQRKKEIHRLAHDGHLGDGNKKIVAKYLGRTEHDTKQDQKIRSLDAKVHTLEKAVHKTQATEGKVDRPYTESDIKSAEAAGEKEQEMEDNIEASKEAVKDAQKVEAAEEAAEEGGEE